MNTRAVAEEIAERLLRDLPAEEVWLFGSQARGEANQDSDMDILAIVEESEMPAYQRVRQAHAVVADIRIPKDIIVLTRDEWRRQEHVVNTLPYIARKEGCLLNRR